MAELGNLFGSNATSGEQKIEVEMLDYGYVRDCKDWNQLSAIVDVLKSGKEGYYPDVSLVSALVLLYWSYSRNVFIHYSSFALRKNG